ncbi:type II toxin-antitoxin system PemK/MazF family toxin [Novosphingobium sp.]|uniref:type II toxin-antitoxin system PemK/MazF family toxin n=1 Tax=Novosphingobium sp. TaxID=1874826 RepID=UPI002FD8D750
MGVVGRIVVRRGEIWLVELDPTVGGEIQKARPCLIVSPDSMNRHLATFTVIPLTSGSRPAPFRIQTRFKAKDGFLLPEQLRTVDRVRLVKRLGEIEPNILAEALTVLREMFEE